MKLLLCPTCHTHRVSVGGMKAAPCPTCGEDGGQDASAMAERTARNVLLGLLIGGSVLGGAFVSCTVDGTEVTDSPSPEVTGTAAPSPEVTGTAAPSPEVTGTAAPTPTP